jgi:hypothetical protein
VGVSLALQPCTTSHTCPSPLLLVTAPLWLAVVVLEHAFKFSETSWVVTVELPAAGAMPHAAGSASGGQSSAGWRVHVYRRRGGRVEANLRLPGSFLRDYQVGWLRVVVR